MGMVYLHSSYDEYRENPEYRAMVQTVRWVRNWPGTAPENIVRLLKSGKYQRAQILDAIAYANRLNVLDNFLGDFITNEQAKAVIDAFEASLAVEKAMENAGR